MCMHNISFLRIWKFCFKITLYKYLNQEFRTIAPRAFDEHTSWILWVPMCTSTLGSILIARSWRSISTCMFRRGALKYQKTFKKNTKTKTYIQIRRHLYTPGLWTHDIDFNLLNNNLFCFCIFDFGSITPKKHDNGNGKSTVWRYISYWKWWFSNVMLVFGV